MIVSSMNPGKRTWRRSAPFDASGLGFKVSSTTTAFNIFFPLFFAGGPGLCSRVFGPFKRRSPPTEPRRRRIFRHPSPQDNHSTFRMQRFTTSKPCDSRAHRSHNSILPRQNKTSALIKKIIMLLSSITLARQARNWIVTRRGMSPPSCCLARTLTANSHTLSIFAPPRPTYRCSFTQHLGRFQIDIRPLVRSRNWFSCTRINGDFSESTSLTSWVNDFWYRRTCFWSWLYSVPPRQATLHTGVTSNNISSGRNSSWREASDWRVEFGNRWSYTPGTTNREVHWGATFRTEYRFRNILCPRVRLLQNIRLFMSPVPVIKAKRLFVLAVAIAGTSSRLLKSLSPWAEEEGTTVASFLQIHAQHHRLLWCHRGLTTSQFF